MEKINKISKQINKFYDACESGDIRYIKDSLLKNGNLYDEEVFNTAINLSIDNNFAMTVVLLTYSIENKIFIDYDSFLYNVIVRNNKDAINYIVENYEAIYELAILNEKETLAKDIYILACQSASLEIFKNLLNIPQIKQYLLNDINTDNSDGVVNAVVNLNIDVVKYFFGENEFSLKPNFDNELYISLCSDYFQKEKVLEILEYLCFDTKIQNIPSIKSQSTNCIAYACQTNNLELLKFLTKRCNCEFTGKKGRVGNSAFDWASLYGSQEMLEYIIYDLGYAPTKKEFEKHRCEKGERNISVQDIYNKAFLFKKLNKNLMTNTKSKSKIKV